MKSHFNQLHSDQGMILFTSLAILSALLMVGVGARVMLQTDYRVLTNLRGATEAFYLATAGLEWSKNEIARASTVPPAPANRSENFSRGAFAVTFLSAALTSPLSAKILVRSMGSVGSSAQTIQAQLSKTYDLVDAALGLRGNGAQVVFGGGGILFSGRDHDSVTGNPIATAKPRAAVTASDDALLGLVNAAARGLPQGSLESGANVAASATSEYLPEAAVSQLAGSLCSQATAIVNAVPAAGVLVYEDQTWGSRSTPELRCIDGLWEPGDAVTLAGNINGSGILVVRNADLIVSGAFRWEGLIIVTGREIGVKVTDASNKEILGGLVINETGTPTSKAILDIQGNFRLLFSRQGLAQTAHLIQPSILSTAYPSLPATLGQDYWRVVTP